MYKKGAIVLVPFPFTDLPGHKVRPALIVYSTASGDDVILLFITSVEGKVESFDVAVAPKKENGLKVVSRIKCSKVATLDKKIIIGELGTISSEVERQIEKKLRTVFSL